MEVEREMAYDSKKLVVHGATGLLVAVFIILSMQFMPFVATAETGVLVLKITDAPPFMQPTSLNITIDSILVHKAGDDNETWIAFDLDGNQTFDLVALGNVTDLIGANELPVGNYTMIKVHISRAIADFNEEKGVELTVPSEYIKIPVSFTIKDDVATIILLDITYDSVVVSAGHRLSPVVHPTVEKQP